MLNQFKKCLQVYYFSVENDASYALWREGEKLCLYFEGSNGKTDWKNNFDFPAKPYRNMKNLWFCHRGFLKVWKSIEPYVSSYIKDSKNKEFEIVGYSHGGAIAQLCYEYVKFHRPDAKISGIGFGAPRVLWGFARKAVKKRFEGFIIVRNKRDIVTHLPPVIFGFRNMGNILKIGSKSHGMIKDHYPENYITAIEEYEQKEANKNECEKIS